MNSFFETYVALCAARGESLSRVANNIGLSNAAANGWKKGKQPNRVTLKKLADYFGVTTESLLSGELASTAGRERILSREALRLAADYDGRLDEWGRRQVRSVMDIEIERVEDEERFLREAELPEDPKIISLFLSPAAAGVAVPIVGEEYDDYVLRPGDPPAAAFAIRVSGNSMEPYFPDGSIAFCNKDPLADGDVGVFSVDGGSVIKQYHKDAFGMVYLFSLNRSRADADLLLRPDSGQSLVCLGRVLTRRRIPLPQ